MTVGDLKAALENYDEDVPVCIGMIQSFESSIDSGESNWDSTL